MRKISDILRTTREEKGISLDAIERATKIKREFLEAIEKGNFSKLPSESHAMGFAKNYAKYLGISPSVSAPLIRREYEAKHPVHIVPEFRKTQHKFNRKLSARSFLIGVVVLIVGFYIFFQYGSLLFPPGLTIVSPTKKEAYENNTVQIIGKTDPYATVSVNGEETYVNMQGKFQKSIYLFSGNNKVKIIAKNRFGKTTEKTIEVNIK